MGAVPVEDFGCFHEGFRQCGVGLDGQGQVIQSRDLRKLPDELGEFAAQQGFSPGQAELAHSQSGKDPGNPGNLLVGEKILPLQEGQWLMFQMGGVGPMLGQAHHFRNYAPEQIEYAVNRYTNEAGRLYRVIDKQLADREFLAGDYSIADIATFPWLRSHENQGQDLDETPNLKRWFETIAARPAVERGVEVLADRRRKGGFDDAQKEILFGATQFARH